MTSVFLHKSKLQTRGKTTKLGKQTCRETLGKIAKEHFQVRKPHILEKTCQEGELTRVVTPIHP